jgi:hypothetical protein
MINDNASDHNTTLSSSFSNNQEEFEHIKYPLIELESDLNNEYIILP